MVIRSKRLHNVEEYFVLKANTISYIETKNYSEANINLYLTMQKILQINFFYDHDLFKLNLDLITLAIEENVKTEFLTCCNHFINYVINLIEKNERRSLFEFEFLKNLKTRVIRNDNLNEDLACFLINIGFKLFNIKNFQIAQKYLNSALQYSLDEIKFNDRLYNVYDCLRLTYIADKDYKKSFVYLKISLSYALRMKHEKRALNMPTIYFDLSEAYFRQKNYILSSKMFGKTIKFLEVNRTFSRKELILFYSIGNFCYEAGKRYEKTKYFYTIFVNLRHLHNEAKLNTKYEVLISKIKILLND
jgi:tetratricopeptide (TPR) repeat protein